MVASIDEIDKAQRQEITDLLLEFRPTRLRRWLSWLKEKQWTGRSLLLFLEFRAYWDEHSQLWEASFWDSRLSIWRPTWTSYNLTRDNQYDLIQYRINHTPDEIIDKAWFTEWESLALWKYGFEAFAAFALFRAGLKKNEDWQNLIDRYASTDLANRSSKSADATIDSLTLYFDRPHRPAMVSWFAGQDWYGPDEWHDGLGW